MPLPDNTTISLQGISKEGDILHTSKPKRAMLVRMTSETLEAIEAQQLKQVDFDFGDNPGIYVGDTFFPMSLLMKEEAPHELYLRTIVANRPSTSLKLHATVTGRLEVERQFDQKVGDKVRKTRIDAEQQRTERKIVTLDAPPVDLGKASGKGAAKKRAAPKRPAHTQPNSLSVTSSAARGASPRTVAPASTRSASQAPAGGSSSAKSLRARLIHFLALEPRTVKDILSKVLGGGADDAMKRELKALMSELAEAVQQAMNDPNPKRYQLQPEAWKEVRPYEWPSLDSSERLKLARTARAKFNALRIPDTNPVWDHVRSRPHDRPASPAVQAGSSRAGRAGTPDARPEPRRAITKETKAKKDATKKKKKDEPITARNEGSTAKNEGSRTTVEVVTKVKGKEREKPAESPREGTPLSASKLPARKLPGSGYKPGSASAASPPSAREASPAPPPAPKRTGPVDVRDRARPAPAPSGSARPAPPIPPPPSVAERKVPASKNAASNARSQVGKDTYTPSPLGAELGREREETPAVKKRRRAPEEESEAEESLLAGAQKKRKLEAAKAASKETDKVMRAKEKSREERVREKQREPDERGREKDRGDAAPQKKSVKREREESPVVPRAKIKKEKEGSQATRSPVVGRAALPSSRASAVDTAPASSPPSTRPEEKHHTSVSSRRRSSINYTSSEEEGESKPAPAVKDRPARPPPKYKPRFRAMPLPADGAGLRRYYRKLYATYYAMFSEKANFVSKMQDRMEEEDESSIALSDSDADSQLGSLDIELAQAFAADLANISAELMKIKQVYESLVNVKEEPLE
ncbi:hypothetical protein WOLCODRAFT_140232 [Wolfiporia cocos MD-104 SS10]|uniref:RNA polymerase II elongation factor ELL N-terminal domain-containing protein n=1 Tax=Wolfiporia cocos (strain MD-104) TaxID=742152 RepID=A0A2H3J8K8_WOLCO|nr:hypothetical protein WOLCODRAFT_140232 [Wolfiporia cocos MD-104 SS10]